MSGTQGRPSGKRPNGFRGVSASSSSRVGWICTLTTAPRVLDRLAEGTDVTEGEKAPVSRITGVVVAIAVDGRDVVGTQRAFEPNLFVGLHARDQIRLSLVEPGLDKPTPGRP